MILMRNGCEMDPLVSIIIPVYNFKDELPRCVESVLNQTYHNLEIILVNDGSTDNSSAICDEYVRKDPRIKCFHQENQFAYIFHDPNVHLCIQFGHCILVYHLKNL